VDQSKNKFRGWPASPAPIENWFPRESGMGEILEVILKAIGELILEFALKGPGYVIHRFVFRNQDANPDGFSVVLCGILFWVLVGFSIWGLVVLM
jgi:hypothetical protein